MKLLDRLLDLLYPPRCLICHEFLEPGAGTVCAECIDTLPEFDGADPHVRFADRCVATFFYEEKLRDSFLRYKFGGRDWYAKQYGKWMAVTIRDKLTGKYDIMTWVPVSRQRKRNAATIRRSFSAGAQRGSLEWSRCARWKSLRIIVPSPR